MRVLQVVGDSIKGLQQMSTDGRRYSHSNKSVKMKKWQNSQVTDDPAMKCMVLRVALSQLTEGYEEELAGLGVDMPGLGEFEEANGSGKKKKRRHSSHARVGEGELSKTCIVS